ncbi:MAG: CPBP family glutamic-type intramembrane protease [Pirellulaceae bacterium]|nr:CPBP family glutamic-type intramembrane protease [Pirellulaceae bacterium]
MSVDSSTAAIHQPLDYWSDSTRPLASLAMVAPFLVAYEAGVLLLGSGAIRNGADVWLRTWLDLAGLGQYFLLPVLVCGILLAWHHARRDAWRIDRRVLGAMWLEAVALGLALLVLAQLQARLLAGFCDPAPVAALATGPAALAARACGYCGAGIYEELLFRLLLLSPAIALLRWVGMNRTYSLGCAIAATSLAFAAAHYRFELSLFGWQIGLPHGDEFTWFSFLFRATAGSVFALVFALRGFGIAVAAHAIYDLLVLAI